MPAIVAVYRAEVDNEPRICGALTTGVHAAFN